MNGWKKYNLEDLYTFSSGLSKPATDFGFGYPFLTFKNVFQNYFLPNQLTETVNSTKKEREILSIKRGDVFFTRTSETAEELGMSSVALKDYPEATFNGFTKRLRPKNDSDIIPKFIGYYFRWKFFRANIISMASETTRASLNNSMLAQLPVFLPPLSEQRAIASVLSSLDDKIDLLHRENATLEKMAETLFRQWFIEEARDDWEEGSISMLAWQGKESTCPSNNPSDYYHVYSIPGYDNGKTPELLLGKDILSNKFKVNENSVLISKLNPRFPRTWLIFEQVQNNSVSSTEFISILPKDKNYLCFLYCLLTSHNAIQELSGAASGTSGSHQRVRPIDIFNLSFSYPSLQYIKDFSNCVFPFFSKCEGNNKQIRTLEKLRDTLLPKLMSGEVRVQYAEDAE